LGTGIVRSASGLLSASSLSGADLPNPGSSSLGGVESITVVSHNFLTGISTLGVPTQAQPAFTDISGTATVTQGGTGDSNPTAHAVMLGEGSSAMTALAPSTTSGWVLTSNGAGADPSYQAPSGGGSSSSPNIRPLSLTTTDTGGNLFPYQYVGSGGNVSSITVGWGVAASLGSDVALQARFLMPTSIPGTGTLHLVSLCQANATTGTAKYTISDADVATTADPSAATLTSETQSSLTASTAGAFIRTATALTESPVANHVSVVAITFNHTSWTLAQILSCNWYEGWE